MVYPLPMMGEHEFLLSVENLELPLAEFSHEAHVRLAWIYLSQNPLPEAMTLFRDTLKKFAAFHGKSAIYHESITFIYLLLIHDRMKAQGNESWPIFLSKNPDLIGHGPGILRKLYTREQLDSSEWRATFRLPDAIHTILRS